MRVLQAADVGGWVQQVLLDPRRRRPVVAVTTRPRIGGTWIEPTEFEAALEGLADVVCLETGDATWELTDALPPRLDVYGRDPRLMAGAPRGFQPLRPPALLRALGSGGACRRRRDRGRDPRRGTTS
jgi:hypothetical protein